MDPTKTTDNTAQEDVSNTSSQDNLQSASAIEAVPDVKTDTQSTSEVQTSPSMPEQTMDNNTSVPVTPAVSDNVMHSNAVQSTSPTIAAVPENVSSPEKNDQPGYTQTKSHNMIMIVVALVVIVALSLIVLFFYQQYKSLTEAQKVEARTLTPTVTKKPTATPTVTPVNDEERELQGIQIEDVDKDLKAIEKDVKAL